MADTPTATNSGATSTIEDAGPCRKRLTIEIPAERVRAKITESFDTVAQQAQLPGFRPGKAPRKLIERRFGAAARDEAKSQLATAAIEEAVKEHKLRVLGDPEGADELNEADMTGDKPIKFTFEVEVPPEFDPPSLENVEIKKPIIDVTEEMVEKEVEKLCVNEGDLVDVEGAPGPGDYLVGRGVLTRDKDGEVIHDIEGAVIRKPEDPDETGGMALGVMVDDFVATLGDAKAGDVVTFKTTGPDQHEVEAIRNEPVSVRFEISAAHRIQPVQRDELARRYGMESEDQLKEAITLRINQRVVIEQQTAMRQQVARHLLDNVSFDLPEKLTANQAERNIERRRLELTYQGVDPQEIDRKMDDLRRSSTDAAMNELKLFFILAKVADERKIGVTEQEVYGRIAEMAAESGQRPEELRSELLRTQRIHGVAQQLREHKTLDALLQDASIVEIPLEEFNAWMNERNAGNTA